MSLYLYNDKEDIDKFNIDIFNDIQSKEIQNWFYAQANKGMKLLDEHRGIMEKTSFNWRVLLTLKKIYEEPTREYFLSILK